MVRYTAAQFDPFAAAAATPIGATHVRDRVAVTGIVTNLDVRQWAGSTPALHATVTDATGSIVVAFLGRTHVAGIDTGAAITVAGAVMRHRGLPLIMNPYLWLLGRADVADEPAHERALVHA